MTTDKDLLEVVRSQPSSIEPWLVYCDWLEENGSEQAAIIRSELVHRTPYTVEDFNSFAAWIERAQDPQSNEIVKHKVGSPYKNDMDNLCPVKLLRNLQRGMDGRLLLKRRAVLAAYGDDPWSMSRQQCLVAVTPERRRSAPRINVRVENVILRNNAQNWTDARWLWDTSVSEPKDLVSAESVRFENASASVAELQAKSSLTEKQRRKLAIHLLDLLRFEEAFELFGIAWHPNLTTIFCQVPFVAENPLAKAQAAKLARKPRPAEKSEQLNLWKAANRQLESAKLGTATIRSELWRAAPWKIKATIDRVFEHRRQNLKTQRECKLRLFALPKQPQQSKLSVIIGCDAKGENHQIYLEFTGSNDRLAQPDWQRDFWFDMRRVRMA